MDIRTLPDEERHLYNKLKTKYSLTFDRLTVNNKKIRILKVADFEKMLDGKDPFKSVSDFPFWIKLWDASMVLAYLFASLPTDGNKRFLELGAGLGAPGLAAASGGFDVTMTDTKEAPLDFQKVSVAASGLEKVKIVQFDWNNPPEMEPFDILAGAEIIANEAFFKPILEIFKTYLKPDGTVYLAHDARRSSLPKFLKLASEDFKISMNRQEIKRIEGKQTIIVNRLKLKEK